MNDKLRNIFLFFIFLLIFAYFYILKFHKVILCDDIFYLLANVTAGKYFIGYFLNKFFIYDLPLSLGFHPNTFVYFYSCIECFIICITLFFFAKFVSIIKKNNLLFVTFLFVSFIFYAYLCRDLYMYIDGAYVTMRYIFSMFLLLCILYSFISIFLEKLQSKKKVQKIILSCIMIFLLTDTTEFFTLFLAIFFTLFIFYSLFQNKDERSKFLFYVSPFFISTLSSSVLYYFFSTRNIIENHLSVGTLHVFFSDYWNILICRIWLIFLLLIISFLYLFFFSFKKEKLESNRNVLFMSVLLCISNFLVMFSFILFDTNFYFNNNVSLVWKMMFLLPLFLLISQIIENFEASKQYFVEKTISILFLCISLIFSLCVKDEMMFFNTEQIKKNKINREEFYLNEKILLYSYLNNTKPELFIPTYALDEFWVIGASVPPPPRL